MQGALEISPCGREFGRQDWEGCVGGVCVELSWCAVPAKAGATRIVISGSGRPFGAAWAGASRLGLYSSSLIGQRMWPAFPKRPDLGPGSVFNHVSPQRVPAAESCLPIALRTARGSGFSDSWHVDSKHGDRIHWKDCFTGMRKHRCQQVILHPVTRSFWNECE